MPRPASVLYALAAYMVGTAALLYLAGFTGDLLVPKSVDRGGGATPDVALGVDLLLLALFGLQHSVMARRGFKRWWTRIVPPVVERSTYLLATCAVLGLLFAFWVPIDAPAVWRLEHRAGVALSWTLFGLGWALVVISSYLIDHLELFGLRQAFARPGSGPPPQAPLQTPMLYRHVRHPLYAGMLLALWSTPVMTPGHLLFASGLTVYVLIGIFFEERDLVDRFGDRYRRYRREVGMLFPRLTAPRRKTSDGAHP